MRASTAASTAASFDRAVLDQQRLDAKRAARQTTRALPLTPVQESPIRQPQIDFDDDASSYVTYTGTPHASYAALAGTPLGALFSASECLERGAALVAMDAYDFTPSDHVALTSWISVDSLSDIPIASAKQCNSV